MQGIEKKIKDHCNSNSLHETVTAKWEKKIALNKPNEGHHLALRFILPTLCSHNLLFKLIIGWF